MTESTGAPQAESPLTAADERTLAFLLDQGGGAKRPVEDIVAEALAWADSRHR